MFNSNLYGNLGSDWEVRTTQAGKKVASNSLAVKNKDKTLWVGLVVWNEKSIETLQAYTSKGSQLIVNGRTDLRTWEKDGKTGAKIEVTVDGFALCGKKEDKETTKDVFEDDIPF